jgi:hypothetical protein
VALCQFCDGSGEPLSSVTTRNLSTDQSHLLLEKDRGVRCEREKKSVPGCV